MATKYNYRWHSDDCVRSQEFFYKGCKEFFCLTHNQWAAEEPVRTTTIYEYGDGEIKEVTRNAP